MVPGKPGFQGVSALLLPERPMPVASLWLKGPAGISSAQDLSAALNKSAGKSKLIKILP
jgi:hypothetical protein